MGIKCCLDGSLRYSVLHCEVRGLDFLDCDCIGDVEAKQELLQWTSVFPDNELLYHYTSPKGIESILRGNGIELRFTRIDCLNDVTEGNSITTYYENVCKQLLTNKDIDGQFYHSIVDLLPKQELVFLYGSGLPVGADGIAYKDYYIAEYITYVFCFSKHADSLPMWNYYLKEGKYEGYSLGFSTSELKNKFHYNSIRWDFISEFVVVEYDDCEKDDILKDYIQALYRFREQDDPQLSRIKAAISRELFKWRYAFKPECFSHEEEARLLIHVPLNEQKESLASFTKRQLTFDDDNGIPKYIYAPLMDKTALRKITLSPLFEENKGFLSELTGKGYAPNINYSKIPLRF